jgi:hypothetical protein
MRVKGVIVNLRRWFFPVAALLMSSCGADEPVVSSAAKESSNWIDSEYRANLERYSKDSDVLIGRGLVANRKHRYVDILATATGAGPETALYTFIDANSSEPVRAISVTTVKPGAIQEALEFIGMKAGHPFDPSNRYHWPKGERVTATFFWDESKSGRFDRSVRAEKLISDANWNAPLPELGLRFVGSSSQEASEIATAFNATNTVLEISYLTDKATIGGKLVASSAYQFTTGENLRVRLRPEYRTGARRVYDFMLDIEPGRERDGEQLKNLHVTLATPDGEVVIDNNFEEAFVYLQELMADGNEPYLQLRFSDSLSATSVKTIARFVLNFLIKQEIRFDPNDEHLFYSAFLPQEAWRDPARRGSGSQPVEIHLESNSAKQALNGEVVQHPQTISSAEKQFTFGDLNELEELIARGQPWETDAIFLFVNANTPYVEIRKIHEVTRTLFPNIYVFM